MAFIFKFEYFPDLKGIETQTNAPFKYKSPFLFEYFPDLKGIETVSRTYRFHKFF